MIVNGDSLSLDRSSLSSTYPAPHLLAPEIKQTFLSTHLASLLASEQSTFGYTRDGIKVTCLNGTVRLQSVSQLHMLLFEKQVTKL